MKRFASIVVGILLLASVKCWCSPQSQETGASQQRQEVKSPDSPLPTFKAADFLIVPVRVHLLRAPNTAAGTSLEPTDIARIFKKANGIWHAAGVHLWVESIAAEAPASLEGHKEDPVLPLEALLPLRPKASQTSTCFHIYYIHAMQPNGIFMKRDALFVKDTAQLRPVPGGIDEPLPRVSAHELGHGMGLPHRQDTTNLMASGTTGTSLNGAEIETVRSTLAGIAWVQTAEEFLKSADKMATLKSENTRTAYEAILELPEPSPLIKKAKEALRKLSKQPKPDKQIKEKK